MSGPLPIIVITHSREKSLTRLLNSLAKADYTNEDIELIISIDYSDSTECISVAEAFQWKYGSKTILAHTSTLGLKKHVLQCGDLAAEKDGAIILEDDLVVSPCFYKYACAANAFYGDSKEIAGISLYRYQYTETRFLPFSPMQTDFDTHFIQVASSWGQIWNRHQWKGFRAWLAQNESIRLDEKFPSHLLNWGDQSWKKHFNRYLIAQGLFFVYPLVSLSTNFEEPGVHANTKGLFQTALQQTKSSWSFDSVESSINLFDGWFEPLSRCVSELSTSLYDKSFEVDLYASKNPKDLKHPLVLTSRSCRESISSWSNEMQPLIQNVAFDIDGDDIHFCESSEVNWYKEVSENNFDQRSVLKSFEDQFQPCFTCIIVAENNDLQNIDHTINSTLNQDVEALRILLVHSNDLVIPKLSNPKVSLTLIKSKNIGLMAMIDASLPFVSTPYCFFIKSGKALKPKALLHIQSILDCYSDVHWLLPTPYLSDQFIDLPTRISGQVNSPESDFFSSFFRTKWFWHENVKKALDFKSFEKLTTDANNQWRNPILVTATLKEVSNENRPSSKKSFRLENSSERIIFFICSLLSRVTKSSLPYTLITSYFRLPDVLRYDQQNGTWYRERF